MAIKTNREFVKDLGRIIEEHNDRMTRQDYCKQVHKKWREFNATGNRVSISLEEAFWKFPKLTNFLKGKKMENLYEVTIVQRTDDPQSGIVGKLTILVPITTVIATGVESAKQLALVEYADQCRTADGNVREGLDVLVRPFCQG